MLTFPTGLFAGEAAIAYTTWNSADFHAEYTLSNGDLTATKTSSNWRSGRAAHGKASGKWYFEVTIGSGAIVGAVGVGNASASKTNYFFVDANGWAYHTNGGKYTNNSGTGSYGTWGAAAVLMVAYDADADKLWLGKNGTWIGSGNPGAGTNEAYSSVSGTIYPMLALQLNTNAGTLNAGASAFTYTPPTGFSGWTAV